jgi:hypothetical protein
LVAAKSQNPFARKTFPETGITGGEGHEARVLQGEAGDIAREENVIAVLWTTDPGCLQDESAAVQSLGRFVEIGEARLRRGVTGVEEAMGDQVKDRGRMLHLTKLQFVCLFVFENL